MSRKHRKAHRASVQRALHQPQPAVELLPHQLSGMARVQWIETQAFEMFNRLCGANIDKMVRTCEMTAALYEQQVNAVTTGGEPVGPDVSPYEHRMSGSLMARLLREKRTWLRDCRQIIEDALAEDARREAEATENEPEEAESPAGQATEAGGTAGVISRDQSRDRTCPPELERRREGAAVADGHA